MATNITGIVIPFDATLPVTTVEFERGDIHAMQDILGGHFEVVDSITYQTSVWINEEGKLLGLPVNARATVLLWLDKLWRRRDLIAGNALLTGPADDDGNTTSAPLALVDLLLHTEQFKAEVQTAGSDNWSSNQLVFTSAFAAMQYVLDLERRWTLVSGVRVVPV